MRTLQESSEDEMIALFLQTEFRSARFHQTLEAVAQQVGINPALLHAPS